MFGKSAVALIFALSVWAGASFSGLGTIGAHAASLPSPTASAAVLNDANRGDCDAIRDTDYWSDEERSWFLSYCVGGSYPTAPAAQPQVVYVYVPVPAASTSAAAPAPAGKAAA